MKLFCPALLICVNAFFTIPFAAADNTAEAGAKLFVDHCALCHGFMGLGDGYLAQAIVNYPDTELLTAKHAHDKDGIKKAIKWGGATGNMDPLSPPWVYILSETEIDAAADFIHLLRTDYQGAQQALSQAMTDQVATPGWGRLVYALRCTQCHGEQGQGDGEMTRIVRNPPPADLTRTSATDDYLRKIIVGGGMAVNRSYQMPPWGDELTAAEIDSVILYIDSIRKQPSQNAGQAQ